MSKLENKIKNLPDKPGVYIMRDMTGNIIYIGKAISLKNRVRQYFQSGKNNPPKVNAMIKNIDDFEYIIVDNEVEALILEANLIKNHKPKYNILLRDDKQYPFIKVTVNEDYPRVLKTREVKKDGGEYFGPYPSVYAVNHVIDIIGEVYPLRTCNRNLNKGFKKQRPCLNYFINRCLGPCQGNISKEEYDPMVKDVLDFLRGNNNNMAKIIEGRMQEASSKLDFEEAARYRDQLESLKILKEKQKVVDTKSSIDQDVIAVARGVDQVSIQVFFIRMGKIIGREDFIIEDRYQEKKEEIISSFIKQFYIGISFIPKELIIESELDDGEAIEKWLSSLRGSKVRLTVPKKGEKLDLINMVRKNALDSLKNHNDQVAKRTNKSLEALGDIKALLDLDSNLNRIESYDISNISGAHSVGSMVVFEKGVKKPSDYRRFRIRDVQGPDDYTSMEEILTRRFRRGLEERKASIESGLDLKGFSVFPDLIMMDGGKGQVNVALRVLEHFNLNIPVCGLVKDEIHTTRGIIYNNKEYRLDLTSRAYRLIYEIQEEVHRFAISYHRSLRSKDMFKSELDGIPGIGDKRKKDLLKHFKSIEKIKKASIEELQEVESMNIRAAESLYNHFRKE